MLRQDLITQLQSYKTRFSEEEIFVPAFLKLLEANDAYQRTHLPGHITGSAWIINRDQTKALLVHHAKLNRWLQPGGHCDGDENVLRVALKEATEETGLLNLTVLSTSIFDLDIHRIPERKDFPAHDHYDVRFLLEANEQETILVSEESHDVRWIALDQLENYNPERALLRLREKLKLF